MNMKTLISKVFLASTLLVGGCSVEETMTGFLPSYVGEWNAAPRKVPTMTTPDGAICGNGDIGMVVGGSSDQLKFYFSKNDFWKAQAGYPNGGVSHIGHLAITAKDLEGASFDMKQSLADATLSGSFAKADGVSYEMKSWCSANKNMAVVQLRAGSSPVTFHLDLVMEDKFDAHVEGGSKEDVVYKIRKFDTPTLEWSSAVAVGLRVIGKESASDFSLKAGEEVYVVLSFCTNHEQKDFVEGAIQLTQTTNVKSLETLYADHKAWWSSFWNESEVHLDDPMLEKYYYGSQYLLACCSRNTAFPPGLWGTMLTVDNSAWCGDYHLNYNHMAPWWAVYSSNHIALSEPFDTPILEYVDKAKQHAKEFLNKKGVYYPVGIGPKGFCSSMFPLTSEDMMKVYGTPDNDIESGYMFLGQKSNAVFCTTNMFMRYYSTYDKAYAEKVYPFIRQVADFWEDYLVFEDGRYVDYNDAFWEVGPWEGKNWKINFGDYNPTQALGLCRMLFTGIIDMSSFLGRDSDKLEKWNHILAHLSDIPTVVVDGVTRVKACEGGNGSGSRTAPGFGRVMAHGLVFPSGAFGPMRTPEFAQLLLDEVCRWNDPVNTKYEWSDSGWDNSGNGFETYYACAARLGYEGEKLIAELKKRIEKTAQPNLWIEQSGGGIECFSAVPSCINEMLLQSYEGVVRVFPAWPKERAASFRDLRAYGAFLITSSCQKGCVKSVSIKSEKGRLCKMENPWKGQVCVVTHGDGSKESFDSDVFEFSTQQEETVHLTVSR